MDRTRWIERKFSFDFPEGILPNIVERLLGTVPRLKEMTVLLSDAETSIKPNGKWSVKEHIGHLVDLEDLHVSRLKEMIARKPELTAADMANKKTDAGDHNIKKITALIDSFANKRETLIELLLSMDDETQLFSSLHPRLLIQMRPVDVACFTAEHDDHHLASIREIILKK